MDKEVDKKGRRGREAKARRESRPSSGKKKKPSAAKTKKQEQKKERTSGFYGLDSESIIKKINRFVRYNSIVITVGIIFSFIFLDLKLSGLSNTVEDTLVKNTKFIKENIGHPIFLAATGQVVVAEKTPMSYSDSRFQSYIINNFTQAFVGGAIKYSDNFKIVFSSGKDIYKRSRWIRDFAEKFLSKQNGYKVLKNYLDGIYFSIVDAKFPEYIEPLDYKVVNYRVYDVSEDNQRANFEIGVEYRVIVKSWIEDLSKWDTRVLSLRINGRGAIDPARYANTGNPFGIRFSSISIPVLLKPTSRSLVEKKERR